MDILKASEPSQLQNELQTELHTTTSAPGAVNIAPLDQEERPKSRTKLRLYLILTALYVIHSASLISGGKSPS